MYNRSKHFISIAAIRLAPAFAYPGPLVGHTSLPRNSATINSSLANRPKAGTKRPRPVSPTGDEPDRMKPPLPAYSSSASSSSSSFPAAAKSTMISSSSSSRVCETTADSIDQASASSSNNASEGDDDEAVVTLGVKPGGGMPRFGRAGVLASSAGARRFEREERGRSAEAEVGEIEDQLWPDKHAPRSVSDLAVHTKKVQCNGPNLVRLAPNGYGGNTAPLHCAVSRNLVLESHSDSLCTFSQKLYG